MNKIVKANAKLVSDEDPRFYLKYLKISVGKPNTIEDVDTVKLIFLFHGLMSYSNISCPLFYY
jgi:hypothetical protein